MGSKPRSLCCTSCPLAMAARRPSGTFPSTFCCSLKPSRRRWEKVGVAHTGGAGGTSSRAFSHLRQQAVAWGLQEAVGAWELGPGSRGGPESSWRWRRCWKTSPAAESWKTDRAVVEAEGRRVATRPGDRNDSDPKAWWGCSPPQTHSLTQAHLWLVLADAPAAATDSWAPAGGMRRGSRSWKGETGGALPAGAWKPPPLEEGQTTEALSRCQPCPSTHVPPPSPGPSPAMCSSCSCPPWPPRSSGLG